ncbi:hypothetical protein ANOM_001705 [Aspergillus nomiae NRRL 13137]|uniref:Zn(2)-C6 fungal-type domain-containing protein n=1 Tax=Aspergillus nomiae NRRL (strain ATCC 15546 / NRRL 13137 / CBS 260.88 / M93) TaxID=1509407 RepID=A0A0L1JDT1_ASPN3|nr:uncharacterized protein ANOM_001705 [Aspergillus nomiae NRRL 13137]KNG89891.1 hypothetical protein ANOM_001705 [Aspergillus nomiae NRRL 13137]
MKSRTNPACGTCRKKCRKCDRARPVCNRCRVKGLHCEGYPPRFLFFQDQLSSKGEQRDDSMLSSGEPSPSQETRSNHTTAINKQSRTGNNHKRRIRRPNQPQGKPDKASNASRATTDAIGTAKPLLAATIDDILTMPETEKLLSYFDKTLCRALIIETDDLHNPFRGYILPLAYHDIGILHAVLGVTMCHITSSGKRETEKISVASMIEHQLSALQSLSSLLMKEEIYGLTDDEQDMLLAVVILLVLYDICETGVSSHGVHLTGAGYICGKLAQQPKVITSPRTAFLLTALAWLDILRGFSGAEKLAYSDNVRRCIFEAEHFNLEILVGCPVELFYEIGCVLTAGKQHMDGRLSQDDFQDLLNDAEQFFRVWNPNNAAFPGEDPEWIQLAEAYRHVCIIRVLRFPDTWGVPCEDHRIQSSVRAILDASAGISADSTWFKRLLFPLFIAGAETSIPHQNRYVDFCMREIKESTGFPHPAMDELLTRVWGERQRQAGKPWNIPWMEFTCSRDLVRQHDSLMF